jgi:hypothetical protein
MSYNAGMKSVASKVLMIRPTSFRSNEQTRPTNSFQKEQSTNQTCLEKAREEHQTIQNLLLNHGIDVLCFEEKKNSDTPDALFPNNWFCTIPGGTTLLFPMMALNRRREFRTDILHEMNPTASIVDLRPMEKESCYLEGTGSLILDHSNRTAFACLSPRTTARALREFEKVSGYRVFSFSALDPDNRPIYHTNVMMALGEKSAILYTEGIVGSRDRDIIVDRITSSGRELVYMDSNQLHSFAGNMLLLKNQNEQKFWIGSTRAVESLNPDQKKMLEKDGEILHAPIPTIENYGGGGVRCLLAEVFG